MVPGRTPRPQPNRRSDDQPNIRAGQAYASSHDLGLGEGGIERVVAYPQTVCLIVTGFYLAARSSARQGPRTISPRRAARSRG
jgi:hypothetical protein